jgi:hypothetical protein
MITLTALRDFLTERGRVSIKEIGIHFDSSPDAARQAIDLWVAKGRVRRVDGAGCCPKAGAGSCACASAPDEIFEWTGGRPAAS